MFPKPDWVDKDLPDVREAIDNLLSHLKAMSEYALDQATQERCVRTRKIIEAAKIILDADPRQPGFERNQLALLLSGAIADYGLGIIEKQPRLIKEEVEK